MRTPLLLSLASITLGVSLFGPSSAHATQPLSEFLASARDHNFDAREQTAKVDQTDWERATALGALLPSFTARGVYQRNQYEVVIPAGTFGPGSPEAPIQKKDALNAVLQLDVPIIDLASYHQYKFRKHFAEAQRAQLELTQTNVVRGVAMAYYQFLGTSALVESAGRNLKIAEENFQYVSTRRDAGVATDLDLERARARVEEAKQNVADAELGRATSARSLETLSGLTPQPATEFPADDLRPETDLAGWLGVKDTPTDKLTAKIDEANASSRRAAAYALAPKLSANAQEQFTNQAGFVGRNNYYVLQGVLSWRLDYASYAGAQATAAATRVASVNNERARRGMEDTIFNAYRQVEANIAKSRSARAQAAAALKAADLASERYQAGAATQLEVTQAQRDSFQAEANRIQADANLTYSRISLRMAAGKPLPGDSKAAPLPAEQPLQQPPTNAPIDGNPSSAPATTPSTPQATPPAPPTR